METTCTRTTTTTILLGAFLFLAVAAGGAAAQERAPARDTAVQAAIRDALHAESEDRLAGALDALRALSGPEHRVLIPQLVLFTLDATDTREAMAFGGLVSALRIPGQDVVGALVPLLEVPDPTLLATIAGVLSEYEDRSVDRGPSFSVYRPFLEAHVATGEGWPVGLLRYLYETEPSAAFLLLLRLHVTDPAALKPLLWAEHVVEESRWKRRFGFLGRDETDPGAMEQLSILGRHAQWWARLYAAQVLVQEPALRTEALMSDLRQDPHPLVRDVAAALAPAEHR